MSRRFQSRATLLLLGAGLWIAGCERVAHRPATRAAADAAPPRIEVRDGRGQLFSFFDRLAELRTVERIDQVEPQARGQVMVVDPQTRPAGDRVFVVDLRKKASAGGYRVWIEPKGTWLARNMPKLSTIKALGAKALAKDLARRARASRRSALARRRSGGKATGASKGSASAAESAGPRVVMFSTSWCPSCKAARAYFQQRGVTFAEFDVEKDPQAAQQYMAIAQKLGLKAGAVPLIVIDGRVFQGFSKPQIAAALDAAPPAAS